jgi:hypothetical protein
MRATLIRAGALDAEGVADEEAAGRLEAVRQPPAQYAEFAGARFGRGSGFFVLDIARVAALR